MDKIIWLDKFDVSSADPQANNLWRLWYHNFTNYLSTIAPLNPDKLKVLYISATIADIIEGCSGFEHAIELLKAVYDKPPNVIHARHLLSICRQQENESIDQYLQALNRLAIHYCFRDVTATTYRDESVCDAFIHGIRSSVIHARRLENDASNLQETTQCARALEQAHLCAELYASRIGPAAATSTIKNVFTDSADVVAATTTTKNVFADPRMECAVLLTHDRCNNCGVKCYPKDDHCHCPAHNKICQNCGKLGHFAKVCRSTKPTPSHSTSDVIVARVKDGDWLIVKLKGKRLTALIDTGSSDNFISAPIIKTMNMSTLKWGSIISIVSSTISLKLFEYCTKNIIFNRYEYKDIDFQGTS